MRFVALIAVTIGLLRSENRCLPCHSGYVASYARTGMGRSISQAGPESPVPATIRHELSGTTFQVLNRSGEMVHQAIRNGISAACTPVWAIGSGNEGKSYLHVVRDALFQSPISWYTRRAAFDLSPGFEREQNPGFFRPVTPDCLFCHTGSVRPRPGTQNRYFAPPFQPASIDCGRCHGDPERHLAEPRKGTIVNPARLEPERRDAVCEQCHLSGEARIPNPSKQFSDFRPGMRMEDVFSVYVRQTSGDSGGLKVVSHSEQLALSRCFLESDRKLWCGSCHDPHREPVDRIAWYREKCLACHTGPKIEAHRNNAGSDCSGCHMPSTRAWDGGHTAFHDHRIGIGRHEPAAGQSLRLRAWREPARTLRNRNLGLAYISTGSKSGDSKQLGEGFRLLGSEPADGAVETARGLMLLRMNKPPEATAAFRRAVDEDPQDSTRRYNLAVALLASGDRAGARRNAEAAIALEPLLEDAYALLAAIDPEHAAEWRRRYLQLLPQRSLR